VDSRLVQRAQHGDREAFAAVVLTVGDQLQSLAHRILRRSDLAEDATQYAFLAIWNRLLPTVGA
jgi:DNA-directed RNA polymerase specialized sigma24 family protein